MELLDPPEYYEHPDEARAEELEQQIATLRQALEPLAAWAAEVADHDPDDARVSVTIGECRAARAALDGTPVKEAE